MLKVLIESCDAKFTNHKNLSIEDCDGREIYSRYLNWLIFIFIIMIWIRLFIELLEFARC